jgi:T5orf172 domain
MGTVKNLSRLRLVAALDYRYIYILGNTRYWFRYKIGIAHDVEMRKRSIASSQKGDIVEFFAAKFFFSQRIEQFFHFLYKPLNARMKGSGKTEWFWMFLPITPTILLCILWVLQWILVPSLVATLAYLVLHHGEIASSLAQVL